MSKIAQSAGVSVRATKPDKQTATATVTENCRYSSPAIPPKKATGMKTELKTRTMATSAPETSCIAVFAASRGFMPLEIKRETFSRTTIASSTTIPMTRVIAKSVSVLSEKLKTQRPAIVPIKETGTDIIGMSVARQFCRNKKMTIKTRRPASKSVFNTSRKEAFTKTVVSSVIV